MVAAVLAATAVSTTSSEGSPLVLSVLLAAVLLGGGVPLYVAARRQNRIRQALEQADFARLALLHARPLSSRIAGNDPLRGLLEAAPDRDLVALGDAALATTHPLAAIVLGEVHRILLRRRRERRLEARRRAAWRVLRDELGGDGETSS